jgi:DNA-binding transcriptional ArsR family regulator
MSSPGFRSLMWYLLCGTRGGPNRQRLLEELRRSPANAHQLAALLGLDYRTIRHHLRILERNGAVYRPVGNAYATPYEISGSAAVYLETIAASPAVSHRLAKPIRRRSATGSSEGSR